MKLLMISTTQPQPLVAPYVGAWIETLMTRNSTRLANVAPYVGAWIETGIALTNHKALAGRTLRGCVD